MMFYLTNWMFETSKGIVCEINERFLIFLDYITSKFSSYHLNKKLKDQSK